MVTSFGKVLVGDDDDDDDGVVVLLLLYSLDPWNGMDILVAVVVGGGSVLHDPMYPLANGRSITLEPKRRAERFDAKARCLVDVAIVDETVLRDMLVILESPRLPAAATTTERSEENNKKIERIVTVVDTVERTGTRRQAKWKGRFVMVVVLFVDGFRRRCCCCCDWCCCASRQN